MRSHRKRIRDLENRNEVKNFWPPVTAVISHDSIIVYPDKGSIELPDKKALQKWMIDNSLDETDLLKVLVMDEQGNEPEGYQNGLC